jgi:hypothetical protein
MLNAVKAKLAFLIHTKVGATVVAAVLVAGGGSTVAMAATHGNLNPIGAALVSATGGNHESTSGHESDSSTTHESTEGTLTAYTAPNGSTPGSITVQPDKGSAVSFVVTSNTKVNGYHTEGPENEATEGPENEGTPSASQHSESTPSASHESEGTPSTSQHSESTPSTSHESSSDSTGTLSDLAAAKGHKVQVQADKSGSSWVASKVTIEAAQGGADNESGDGSGTGGHESTPTARPTESGGHESTPTAKPTATGVHD